MHRRGKPQQPQAAFESQNKGEASRRMNYVTATYFLLCKRKELLDLTEKLSSAKQKESQHSDDN